jgi:hypothetical protein
MLEDGAGITVSLDGACVHRILRFVNVDESIRLDRRIWTSHSDFTFDSHLSLRVVLG